MVSVSGLMGGLTATGVLFFYIIIGLFFLYKSRKTEAELLFYAGLMMVFMGLMYLGPFCEFMSVLLLGKNMNFWLYVILTYMWVAPAIIIGMYIGAELMLPEKKLYIVGIYIILGIIFELFLWLDTANAITYDLGIPGEDVYDASFKITHPTFILIAIFLISALIFLGFGFAIKGNQTTGSLRKKFFLISIGFFIFVVCGILETVVPGLLIFITRSVMITPAWFWYNGLKS